MKSIKFAIAALLSTLALTSCFESLPADSSPNFARYVVLDIYEGAITEPIEQVALMHKASLWLAAAGNSSEQQAIEDSYFNMISPRVNGDTITIITKYSTTIEITYNGTLLTEAGAAWQFQGSSAAGSYTLTANNTDGTTLACAKTKTSGVTTLSFDMTINSVDNYNVELEGLNDACYANSPVCSQSFTTASTLIYIASRVTNNSVIQDLKIVDGKITIELYNSLDELIEDDQITANFKAYEYAYNEFDPLINFRGNSFYYSNQNYVY